MTRQRPPSGCDTRNRFWYADPMKKPRQHLRLDFQRRAAHTPPATRLDASRKRLLALALGASLGGAAACGELETIPAPDAGVVDPPSDTGASSDAATALTDAGFLRDTSERNDAGESADDGGLTDAGEQPPMPMPEDAGDAEGGDTGVVPPMPPPRDAGVSPRDTGVSPRDTGTSSRDTGVSPRDTGVVPPMPPPRDTGISGRDIGELRRDAGREIP